MLHIRNAIVSTFLLVAICTVAQQPVYDIYGIDQGLASNTVYCVTQDNDGYLWIGTDAGVSRFDGTEFRNFTIDDGLCDNEILRVAPDSKGRIWFLSLSGCLACYDHGVIRSSANDKRLAVELNTLGMTNLIEDGEGRLWFGGMDRQVVCFDEKKAEVITIDSAGYLPANRGFTDLYLDAENRLVFLRPNQFLEWNGSRAVATNQPLNKFYYRNCYARGSNGEAYVLSPEGLLLLENTDWKVIIPADSIVDYSNVQGLFTSGEGRFWVAGFFGGVDCFDVKNGKLNSRSALFVSDWINFVFEDSDHNTWYATRENGLYCVTSEKQRHHFYPVDDGRVTCLEKSDDDILYYGTSAGDIYMIDLKAGIKSRHFLNWEEQIPINRILADSNFLYISSVRGIFRMERNGEGTATKPTTRYNVSVPKDMEFAPDGTLYFVTLRGIEHIDPADVHADAKLLEGISAFRRYNVCVAHDGKLWFENHDKLYYYDSEGTHDAKALNDIATGRISSISETENGMLVVTTRGSGTWFLKDGIPVASLGRRSGLPSDECEQAHFSGDTYYIVTAVGLSSCRLEDGQIVGLRNYTVADGIPDARIFDIYIREDALWLATHIGLFRIGLSALPVKSEVPRVHFLHVLADKERSDPQTELAIRYGQRVAIDYTAVTFDLAREARFEYALDDTSAWTSTSNRSIELTALSSGTHRFFLRGRKYNSDWSKPLSMALIVEPPWWGTWWFRLGALLLLAAGASAVIRYLSGLRVRRRMAFLEQEQALLLERNRISTDLHDDLGAELSNIVILTRIARSKLKLTGVAAAPIDQIDRAASDIINKMSGIIWALNPVNDRQDNLVDYIRRYTLDFLDLHAMDGGVEVVGVPSKAEVKGIYRRNAFLVVKEALHNVYKHADASQVNVIMYVGPDELKVLIKDNGKGFDTGQSRSGGLGLNSMKKRILDIGGRFSIESKPDLGTEVEVVIGF